jgi:hypothetical protein
MTRSLPEECDVLLRDGGCRCPQWRLAEVAAPAAGPLGAGSLVNAYDMSDRSERATLTERGPS